MKEIRIPTISLVLFTISAFLMFYYVMRHLMETGILH